MTLVAYGLIEDQAMKTYGNGGTILSFLRSTLDWAERVTFTSRLRYSCSKKFDTARTRYLVGPAASVDNFEDRNLSSYFSSVHELSLYLY